MKKFRVLFAVAALTALTAMTAAAHPATPRVDRREARQQARIHDGVRSGELTRGEAARLRAGQRHVRRMECRAKADGVVTMRERASLGHAQNRQSRHIARLKHNGRAI
jgi:hypothetical protein